MFRKQTAPQARAVAADCLVLRRTRFVAPRCPTVRMLPGSTSSRRMPAPRFSVRKCRSRNSSGGSAVRPSPPRSRKPVRASASSAMRWRAMASPSNASAMVSIMAQDAAACHHIWTRARRRRGRRGQDRIGNRRPGRRRLVPGSIVSVPTLLVARRLPRSPARRPIWRAPATPATRPARPAAHERPPPRHRARPWRDTDTSRA